MDSLLRPPTAFAMVEDGLYRSCTIDSRHFSFVRRLGLRTVIMLSLEHFPPDVTQFYADNKIHTIMVGMSTWKPSVSRAEAVSEELVKEAIELMLVEGNRPCLVMCTTGVRLTGTVVGCLRKLQRWCFSSILDEHRSIASDISTTYESSELFIELFDTDLITIPQAQAKWYRRGLQKDKEELEMRKSTADVVVSEQTGRVPAYLFFFFDARSPLKSTSLQGPQFSYD